MQGMKLLHAVMKLSLLIPQPVDFVDGYIASGKHADWINVFVGKFSKILV